MTFELSHEKPCFLYMRKQRRAETDLVPYGFRYILQSLYLLENPKFQASIVQFGFCRTLSETRRQVIFSHYAVHVLFSTFRN